MIVQHVVVFNILVCRTGEEPNFRVNSSLSTWECYSESNVPPAHYRGPAHSCWHDILLKMKDILLKTIIFSVFFDRNWNMRTLLLYWTFRYVILHPHQTCKSYQEQYDCTVSRLLFTYMIIAPLLVPVFSSVIAHKVEQMGCCLFHMTHFRLMQLEQFCFPYLLNEASLHRPVPKNV